MSTAASINVSQGFSKPGVHSFTYKDDFCSFAANLREELLHYPKWKEMQQNGLSGGGKFVPERQNGITTGHLQERDRERLPFCWKFGDFLKENFGVLCPLLGIDPGDALYLEMNAMAYGAGAYRFFGVRSHSEPAGCLDALSHRARGRRMVPGERRGRARLDAGKWRRTHPPPI